MIDTQQLAVLIEQLHEVNQTLAQAALPLKELDALQLERRQQVAAQLRTGLERWETLTHQISDLLDQYDA